MMLPLSHMPTIQHRHSCICYQILPLSLSLLINIATLHVPIIKYRHPRIYVYSPHCIAPYCHHCISVYRHPFILPYCHLCLCVYRHPRICIHCHSCTLLFSHYTWCTVLVILRSTPILRKAKHLLSNPVNVRRLLNLYSTHPEKR